MKTILILISIMILGLYSCEKESTNPTPNPNEEIKKYTLEEILSDTNWVEITDTLHYENRYLMGYSYLHDNYVENDILKFTNIEDYSKIESMSDTTSQWYISGDLKYDIDFSKNDMIGFLTHYYPGLSRYRKIFKNDLKKEYQYFVIVIDYGGVPLINAFTFNFVKIPKMKNGYILKADTLWRKNNL